MSPLGTFPQPKREVMCASCGTESLQIEMERNYGVCLHCQSKAAEIKEKTS